MVSSFNQGKRTLGRSFNQGKRTWVYRSIKGKDHGFKIRGKELGSFNQGKRTWLVRSIRGKELGSFIQSGEKNLGRSFNQWFFQSREKNLGCSFNQGKRTCVSSFNQG